MLRANLSTRPFYNERAVAIALGVFALLVVAASVFNVTQLARLTSRQAVLASEIQTADRRAADLRRQAAQARASVDQRRLDAVAADAREANALIDQRTFSWTDLFNRFEATLPPDVRITAVRPTLESDGRLIVSVSVVARSVDDIDAFIEALEATRAFEDVLSRSENTDEEGQLNATLRGVYRTARMPAAAQSEEVSQ
jgi:Tfp pilus assembly protein PilN